MNASVLRALGLIAAVLFVPTLAVANAPAGHYVITSGGTAMGTVYDTKSKLTWQQAVPSTNYTWSDAKSYCGGVSASLGGAGWRLPTVRELASIADYTRSIPAIDPNAFPGTPSSLFWSATPSASYPNQWYAVDFGAGFASYYPSTVQGYVRCVRGGT
jgi:hypothetical protein